MPSIIKPRKSCRLLMDDQQQVSKKYKYFKGLLDHNRECLQLISTIESIYYRGEGFDRLEIQGLLGRLQTELSALVEFLNRLSDRAHLDLTALPDSILTEIRRRIDPRIEDQQVSFTLPLGEKAAQSAAAVGSKAANLSIIRTTIGLPIPNGFAITTAAEAAFLSGAGLRGIIQDVLSRVHASGDEVAEKLTLELRERIMTASLPQEIETQILTAYDSLAKESGQDVSVAVRSSAVGEDTASSFAGQYHTELNVLRAGLIEAYKRVIASRFTTRAIQYRRANGFEEQDTPMGVACLRMIDAAASGVIYTTDPVQPDSGVMRIAAVAGMGERLVSGEASPTTFFVEKASGRLVRTEDSQTPRDQEIVSNILDEHALAHLCRMADKLGAAFNGPQDIEWAMDESGKAFVLQSRPLGLVKSHAASSIEQTQLKDRPVLLAGGLMASPGIASGTVCKQPVKSGALPERAILVARSASIDLTKLLKKATGLITDVGSPASHLATVAREFGIPAIVDARGATTVLPEGETVTLVADSCKVYQGGVDESTIPSRTQNPIFESPMFQRLRDALDLITPLNLQDPKDSSFSPAGCRTVHDIVRFCHEMSLKSMFGLIGGASDMAVSEKLSFNIPISLHFIDLGGGLQEGLSSCDRITPDSIQSIPMNALWKGLSHPGINWSSAVPVDMLNLATLMSATPGEGLPGGDSYALVSQDYANVSIKFGYHYCNVDSFCGNNATQNYVTMQFAGGVGSYYGKVLRVEFLSKVLTQLGFVVTANGDSISASLNGLDLSAQADALDQLGRLLAASRLLDVGIRSEQDVERMTQAFFRSEYDFMNLDRAYALPGFYVPEGDWECRSDKDGAWLVQDGSKWTGRFSQALARRMNRMVGTRYQQFLDNIQAYFYFPLAIAKAGYLSSGSVRAAVKPIEGVIDQAGGIAFGIQNIGNYFVFRLNSLEDNVILFEYVNSRRIERKSIPHSLSVGQWYHLRVNLEDRRLTAFLDDKPLMSYEADRSLSGYVGLWTKADSVTAFDHFDISTSVSFIDLFSDLRSADFLRKIE